MKRRRKSRSSGIFNIGFSLNRMMGTPKTMKKNSFNFNNIIGKSNSVFNYNKVKPTNFNKLFNLKDSDRDGVANVFDCQPYNRRYQDVRPNALMMERYNQLPVYVQSKSDVSKVYHISSKQVPKQEKRKVYSLLKRYPTLPTRIEKSKRATVFTTAREEGEKPSEGKRSYGFYGENSRYTQLTPKKRVRKLVVVRMTDEPYAKKYETKYTSQTREEAAKTLVHEQEHVKQYKSIKKRPSLRKRWFKKFRTQEGYEKQKGEVKAREAEKKYSADAGKRKEIPTSTRISRAIGYVAAIVDSPSKKEMEKELQRKINEAKEKEARRAAESFKETFKEDE